MSGITEAVQRGNIRLRGNEIREYERMIMFISEHPGASRDDIKKMVFNRKVPLTMYLALAKKNGVVEEVLGGYILKEGVLL